MATATTQHLLLSPAELAYLHSTLRQTPPIRPDGRGATQFRPLTAETGILPGANGSARVCFADGTEAIVGVKAEVEKTRRTTRISPGDEEDSYNNNNNKQQQRRRQQGPEEERAAKAAAAVRDDAGDTEGENDWVEMTVEIPGYRDDDSNTVFLAAMLSEALLADGALTKKLWINQRFHWKLYLDIILISPPLSYPLPLLSLTTHLALLSTRLPRLKSEADEDPMFDDDWAASVYIYPPAPTTTSSSLPPSLSAADPSLLFSRPPITLLVMAVGDSIIFDPSKEELAVADSVLAVSVGEEAATPADYQQQQQKQPLAAAAMDVDEKQEEEEAEVQGRTKARNLRLLSVRTIDPPSRLTAPGVPNAVNAAAWGQTAAVPAKDPGAMSAETEDVEGVWKAPRGGAKMAVLGAMVQKVLEKGGLADEVLEALDGVELG
ncbi:ribosomal protein S5 domain 2-type protein [Biscogniauxia mediterranea]|nr:ribosomal protein S5 domain 2-type protein [Biscogniauxia mediterranea]